MTSPSASPASATLQMFHDSVAVLDDTITGIRVCWDGLVAQINAVLTRIQQAINDRNFVVSLFEKFTGSDLQESIQSIISLTDEARKHVDEVLKHFESALRGSVPVLSLLDTAVAFNSDLIGPFSNIGTKMESSGKILQWIGPSRAAYDAKMKEQTDAVDSTNAKLIATSSWLAQVGQANLNYMTDLGRKATDVLHILTVTVIDSGLTAAGAATQAPLAIKDFSELIGQAVATLAQYLLDLADYLGNAVVQVNEITNSTMDYSGLGPNGTWPTISGVDPAERKK